MGWFPAGLTTTTAPYQFNVASYGAKGNGKIGTGGTGTSGLPGLTDAGASFTSADQGKLIIVNQGANGSATNPFCGTILSVNSATSITLSGNLAANAANAPYFYASDDAAAITAAVNAAAAYAIANDYKAQVLFQPLLYGLGALTQQTSTLQYNTHIPLPVSAQFARKLVLDFVGVGDASEPDYWESTVPSLSGTCLVSCVFGTGQPNGTFGFQSIIGAPNATTGLGPGNFANHLINFQGITMVAPWNAQQYGIDSRLSAQLNGINGSYLAFAPVNLSGQSIGGPYLSATNLVSNNVSVGAAWPNIGNNDNCNAQIWTVEGAALGVQLAEHFNAYRIALIYCNIALSIPSVGSTTHGSAIQYASIEACGGCLNCGSGVGNTMPFDIGVLDQEVINVYDFADQGNCLLGRIGWYGLSQSLPILQSGTGAANLEILNYKQPRAVQTAPAYTLGTTFQNPWWRHAYISLAGGTTTGVTIGPTSALATTSVGTTTPIVLRLPSGWWINIAGSVKPTTFNVFLD